MTDNGSNLSVRLTREEQVVYDRVLRYYNVVSDSKSKSFKLLLARLGAEVSRELEKAYYLNRDFEPPTIEHGSPTETVDSEDEFFGKESEDRT